MQIVLAVHNILQFSVCRHVGYVGQSSRHGDRLLKKTAHPIEWRKGFKGTVRRVVRFIFAQSTPYGILIHPLNFFRKKSIVSNVFLRFLVSYSAGMKLGDYGM